MDAIKEITQRFIEARPNDRIGMLAFAGRPYLVSPPTLDHTWLIDNLDRVKIGLVEDGTAIGSALVSAANRLKNREAKSRIIVLLSDGDNNAGRVNPDTAAEAVRVLGLKVYTIGVGTNGIAPYPVGKDPFTGETRYENVQVEYDEKTLREVARIANGQFFRADSSAEARRNLRPDRQARKDDRQGQQIPRVPGLVRLARGAAAADASSCGVLTTRALSRRRCGGGLP